MVREVERESVRGPPANKVTGCCLRKKKKKMLTKREREKPPKKGRLRLVIFFLLQRLPFRLFGPSLTAAGGGRFDYIPLPFFVLCVLADARD